MAGAEPVKYVSVPVPRGIWLRLRMLAAVEGKSMAAMVAGWVLEHVEAAAARLDPAAGEADAA